MKNHQGVLSLLRYDFTEAPIFSLLFLSVYILSSSVLLIGHLRHLLRPLKYKIQGF